MPIELHFLDQIINVQWGGKALFVVKSANSDLYRGNLTTPPKGDWQTVGQPYQIFGGFYSGSSYAEVGKTDTEPGTPVFVINAVRTNHDGNNGSIILASRDGLDWQLVFERYEVNEGYLRDPWIFEPTGIVWDADSETFYAAFYTVVASNFNGDGTGIIVTDGERIYKSSDGSSWFLVIDDVTHDPGLTDDDVSQLLQFCKKPENTKGNKKMPDGLQGYDKATKTFIKPTSLVSFSPVNGAIYDSTPAASVDIIIETDEGETRSTTSVSAPCYAVAQINGIWSACGGNRPSGSPPEGGTFIIDVSTDKGESWTKVYTGEGTDGTFPAATVSAGQPPKSNS